MTDAQPIELPLSLGRRIAEARRQTGLNQKDAAAEAGVHRNTIGRYENDVDVPDFAFMVWLSKRSGWPLAVFASAVSIDPGSGPGGPISGVYESPCNRFPQVSGLSNVVSMHRVTTSSPPRSPQVNEATILEFGRKIA